MFSSIGGVIDGSALSPLLNSARCRRICQVPNFDDGRGLIENREIPHGEREYCGLSLSSNAAALISELLAHPGMLLRCG